MYCDIVRRKYQQIFVVSLAVLTSCKEKENGNNKINCCDSN